MYLKFQNAFWNAKDTTPHNLKLQRRRGTSRFLYARWASLRRGGFQAQGVLELVEAMGEDAKTEDEPDGNHRREQQEAQAAQPRRAAHHLRLPADRWMRSLWIL